MYCFHVPIAFWFTRAKYTNYMDEQKKDANAQITPAEVDQKTKDEEAKKS